jgi:riboflavin synthase
MFSGIVEELGTVRSLKRSASRMSVGIQARDTLADTRVGDSIAVNGVCLTVVSLAEQGFVFDVIPETFQRTNLGLLRVGEKVNLERSLKFGDRVSGHLVSGHVDCLGLIRAKLIRAGNLAFDIAIPRGLGRYCLPKGSISLDGISLTLAQIRADVISVYVIPHTLKNTTLGFKGPSCRLNVEFDILAKKSAV